MRTTPRQEYRDLEKLGFLCRWTLLALAGLVILAATWAGMSGTAVISSNLETNMHLSDAVWRQGAKNPSLRGFLDGPATKSLSPLFIHQDHFRGLRFAWANRNHSEVAALLPAPPAGTHRITLRGLPYGQMAFKQYKATLRIVPGPETVYVLDARFFLNVVRNDQPTALRIAHELSRLGQPVLVFTGQRELLANLRTKFDQYSDIRLVFSLRKDRGGLMSVIASITRKLKSREGTYKGDNRIPYVVTADVNVAIKAARQGHYAHLVGAEETPPNLSELIRLHATPETLAEHLADESPAHLPIP